MRLSSRTPSGGGGPTKSGALAVVEAPMTWSHWCAGRRQVSMAALNAAGAGIGDVVRLVIGLDHRDPAGDAYR